MLFSRPLAIFICLIALFSILSAEENFLLLDGSTNQLLIETGSERDTRLSPCSTFKIVLSLLGYDAEILVDETTPTWPFQNGYEDGMEAWMVPQTAKSWIKKSCVWYSRLLAEKLGISKIAAFLSAIKYGNRDFSSGATFEKKAWLNGGSLKISPREQLYFLQSMLNNELPVSNEAVDQTRTLLFVEEGANGTKLFGKTGWSGSSKEPGELETGWFIGWVEKEGRPYPFVYVNRSPQMDLSERVPRAKRLIAKYLQ